jgi:hypothetical protein
MPVDCAVNQRMRETNQEFDVALLDRDICNIDPNLPVPIHSQLFVPIGFSQSTLIRYSDIFRFYLQTTKSRFDVVKFRT